MGTKIKKVKKRDGSIVDFDECKIVKAVSNAFNSSGEHCVDTANNFYSQIINELHKLKKEEYYSVEDIREQYWDTQLRKLALGMCKVILGRIRSKYKSSSSKFQLDGDQLLAEGNAEIQSVRQFLDDNKDIFTVLN